MAANEAGNVSIAVVEDYPQAAETIARYLKSMGGCAVTISNDPVIFSKGLRADSFDIVITDLRMPGMDGIELLKIIRERCPTTDVIVVSGNAEKKDAIEAVKLGAFDFFEKPVQRVELVATVKRTMSYRALVRERDELASSVSALSEREAQRWGIDAFIGQSAVVTKVLKDIRTLQKAPTTPVLVTGESGTGKELVARAIHFGGPRSRGPFIPVNCSAVPSELAESLLFGHKKGSFTGATADRKGSFQLADKGTLFMDEIGDMPATMQAKLLRVLEDGMVVSIGESTGRKVDVRVIAATNANLEERIERQQFRSDLYFRLAGYNIALPPLRDRKEDIPLLAYHFIKQISEEMGFASPTMTPKAMDALMNHYFPGNVRELKNLVERALIECEGRTIMMDHLHFLGTTGGDRKSLHSEQPGDISTEQLPLNMKQAEEALIRRAMSESNGNVSAAARLLGMNRSKLYRKLAAIEDPNGSEEDDD